MRKIYLIMACILLGTALYAQDFPKQVEAFNSIKATCGGDNWTYQTIEDLKARTTSPFIEEHGPVNLDGSNGTIYKVLDLSNNNLQGTIHDTAFVNNKYATNTLWYVGNYINLIFSHNHITDVGNNFGIGLLQTAMTIKLDHNNLTSFFLNDQYTATSVTSYIGVGCKYFCINQNEITSLKSTDLGYSYIGPTLIDYASEEIRIDNNRLDFSSLCEVVPWIKEQYAYVSSQRPGNPDCIFDYYPQKALGGDATEEFANEGTAKNLQFSLTHPDNVYNWTLNDVDIPLSASTAYNFTVSPQTAGVYRCKVTNPNLPDVTLYSYDMAVFMNKSDNQTIEDFQLIHEPVGENFPDEAIIGDFSGTDADGDMIYYRLPDTIANNESFRIINGNTLISSERLFDRHYIESYTIKVEAYDVYGGKLLKEITINKGQGGATPLPSNIVLTNNRIDENLENTVIGNLRALDVTGYSFELPAGYFDNAEFAISDTSLKTIAALDFEIKRQYKIRVKAFAADGTSLLKDFTIMVDDINDAPHEILLSGGEVAVNLPAETFVGLFVAIDQDPSDQSFTFELCEGSGDTNNDEFVIEGNVLKTAIPFTMADVGEKNIRVITKDDEDAQYEESITISIIDPNAGGDNPIINLSNTTIDENNEVNDIIGNLEVLNSNEESFTYTLTDDFEDNASFTIENNQLKAATIFDFETKSTYIIKINASSNDNNLTTEIAIHINNLNEEPIAIGFNNFLLNTESSEGDLVSLLFLKDEDGDQGTFEINGGNDASIFAINQDRLEYAQAIPAGQSVFEINIKATDKGGISIDADFRFFVPVVINGVETINANDIEVFPNPTQEYIKLNTDVKGKYEIISDGGMVVQTGEIESIINMSNLENGSYYLRLMTADGDSIKRIIKMK